MVNYSTKLIQKFVAIRNFLKKVNKMSCFFKADLNCLKVNNLEVAQIMFQMCCAIKYLHDVNIAHRDLKLENFLFKINEDGSEIIKLTDFGFAKRCLRAEGLSTPKLVFRHQLYHFYLIKLTKTFF